MKNWPALLVAGLALLFTVGSFWWLNARRGRIESYAPQSFAATFMFHTRTTLIRLPLVLYNTGASPLVVQDLRLRFPREDDALAGFPWRTSRKSIKPEPDDVEDFPAVFAVPGRTAQQLFIEFGGPFPGVVPRGRDYLVRVEAKLSHKSEPGWTELVTFTLRAGRVAHPGSYIAYSNGPAPYTPNELEESREAADALVRQLGLTP